VETGLRTKMQPHTAAMVIPADVADAGDHDERLTCCARAEPNRTVTGDLVNQVRLASLKSCSSELVEFAYQSPAAMGH
jgi:hypothetical protein